MRTMTMKPSTARRALVLALAIAGGASAAVSARAASFNPESYIQRFRDYAMGGTYLSFYYPLRNSAGTETWYRVNSKWQQPRDEGTTPHQGVDLGSPSGTPVHPPYWGWIVAQSGRNSAGTCCINDPTSGTPLWEMILQLDVNGDNIQNDAVYHKFDHLERVGFRSTGSYVSPSDQVATSGSENGAYGAHLHFGNLNPRSGVTGRWTGMERHYGYAPDYNYGDDLDFISYVTRDAVNVVEATSYVMSSGTRTSITAGNMRLFHRRPGTAWANAAMTSIGSDRWRIDLDALGYPAGTSIQWMVRSSRAGLAEVHNSAFFPAEWAHPHNDPNLPAAIYPSYTATTQ